MITQSHNMSAVQPCTKAAGAPGAGPKGSRRSQLRIHAAKLALLSLQASFVALASKQPTWMSMSVAMREPTRSSSSAWGTPISAAWVAEKRGIPQREGRSALELRARQALVATGGP